MTKQSTDAQVAELKKQLARFERMEKRGNWYSPQKLLDLFAQERINGIREAVSYTRMKMNIPHDEANATLDCVEQHARWLQERLK
jgi:hypothetical protein